MQLSQLICVCALILWLTGALNNICRQLKISGWLLAYSAICVMLLQRFDVFVTPELKLNCAVLLLPAALLAASAGQRGGGAVRCFLFFGALLGALEAAMGFSSSLLLGAVCGFIGAVLWQNNDEGRGFSLFVAAALPVFCRVMACGIELMYTGYTSCDLAAAQVLDTQLAGCAFACLFAYAFKLRRAVIKE